MADPAPVQDPSRRADEPRPLSPRGRSVELPVRINEVMASNKSSLADESGLFPDWVEVYAYGSESVDLGSLALVLCKRTFPLPDGTLEPGEYLVIFCDGSGSEELHARFQAVQGRRRPRAGDRWRARLIDEFEVPALGSDQSAVLQRRRRGRERLLPYPGI